MMQKLYRVVAILLAALFGTIPFSMATTVDELPWNDEYEWNNWYPNVHLPNNEHLTMNVSYGTESYFLMDIDGVYGKSDIENGTYLGWCFQKNVMMTRDKEHDITMFHTYDPNKPEKYKNAQWDIINYIINNKQGATREEIQDAIWFFMEGYEPTSTGSQDLIFDAQACGSNFCPQPGQTIAIIVNLTDDAHPEEPVQRAFIEVILDHYEGETPCYWICTQNHWGCTDCGCDHCDTYMNPDTKIYEIFDVFSPTSYSGNRTVIETLQRCTYLPREMLLREAMAGLLNSCDPTISYPLNCSQIIDGINFEFGSNQQSTWWGYGMFRLFSILYYYNRLGA